MGVTKGAPMFSLRATACDSLKAQRATESQAPGPAEKQERYRVPPSAQWLETLHTAHDMQR